MQSLTIAAASPSSARGMLEALQDFVAELVEGEDGQQQVVVRLNGDKEIVRVLNALERFVTERDNGPTHVELAGRTYSLHPNVDAPPEPAPG